MIFNSISGSRKHTTDLNHSHNSRLSRCVSNHAKHGPLCKKVLTRIASIAFNVYLDTNFVCRFISVSDDWKFNGKSAKTASIEANSLLLARHGVCYIGDWLGLKATSLDYLKNGILLHALNNCLLITFLRPST